MSDALRHHASLPIRALLGFGFVFHGYGKLFAEGGHAMFVGMLQGIGVPAPEATAWAVGALEFFGGLALIVGAAVPVVAVALIGVMATALLTVHLPVGFNFMNMIGMTEAGPQFGLPGFEVNLIYIAGLSSLVLGGAGAWSVDRLIASRRGGVPTPSAVASGEFAPVAG